MMNLLNKITILIIRFFLSFSFFSIIYTHTHHILKKKKKKVIYGSQTVSQYLYNYIYVLNSEDYIHI